MGSMGPEMALGLVLLFFCDAPLGGLGLPWRATFLGLVHPLTRRPPVGRARRVVVCHTPERRRVTGWSAPPRGTSGGAWKPQRPVVRRGWEGAARCAGLWPDDGCGDGPTPTTDHLHMIGRPPSILDPRVPAGGITSLCSAPVHGSVHPRRGPRCGCAPALGW